ncbi:MAG: hypothetical protein IJ141_04450 [Lachnospiraceae bacterium]|nr:hypothetical protein [Lachnospiraceae bacterium]
MSIKEELKSRVHTYHGVGADVIMVLDKFSTQDLVDYYINDLKLEGHLRTFLEDRIIGDEINKAKYSESNYYDEFEM